MIRLIKLLVSMAVLAVAVLGLVYGGTIVTVFLWYVIAANVLLILSWALKGVDSDETAQ